jgi:O-antigen ligase
MVICSIFGALEAYTGWRVASLFPFVAGRFGPQSEDMIAPEGRIQSTFPMPILFGAALAIGLIIALNLVTAAKTTKRRIWMWAAIFIMFLNIYKSVSRGPWLGLILAFVILLLFERPKVRRYQLGIVVLAVLVMVIRPGVYETIRDLYSGTVDTSGDSPKNLSYEYRYELRRVAQQALARDFRRQLWGYGLESFYFLNLEGELAGHTYPFLSCDSAWIELTVETGYVGLLLIALLLLTPAWLAWRDFRRIRGPDRYLSLTFFTCMVSYYFMMMSVDIYAWGQEGYMLWILIALSVVYGGLAETEPKVERLAAEPAVLPALEMWTVPGEHLVVRNYGG